MIEHWVSSKQFLLKKYVFVHFQMYVKLIGFYSSVHITYHTKLWNDTDVIKLNTLVWSWLHLIAHWQKAYLSRAFRPFLKASWPAYKRYDLLAFLRWVCREKKQRNLQMTHKLRHTEVVGCAAFAFYLVSSAARAEVGRLNRVDVVFSWYSSGGWGSRLMAMSPFYL